MTSIFHCWPLLLAALCVPAWAASPAVAQVASFNSGELRRAVESHRAEQREEVKREEAAAGRHLTAGELAELREQVRRQWMPAVPSHMQDTRRNVPPSAPQLTPERALTLPRSQRR
ncbi:MAG: hypothetical protein V4636_24410 [Pseudomonadota bacterium]